VENHPGKSLLIAGLVLLSCSAKPQKKSTSVEQNTARNDSAVQAILEDQLEAGVASNYELYDWGEEDLQVTLPYVEKLLTTAGYEPPDSQAFEKRVKEVFGRTIDPASSRTFLTVDATDPCNREAVLHPASADFSLLYIVKNARFLTELYPLPLLLDYQRVFPASARAEQEPIIVEDGVEGEVRIDHWKDLHDLPARRQRAHRLLVARNKYLFHNDREAFTLLTRDDPQFLSTLLTAFGYDEDPELVDFVLDRAGPRLKNPADLGELLTHRGCDGAAVVHEGVLRALVARDGAQLTNNLRTLQDYALFLRTTAPYTDPAQAGAARLIAHLLYYPEAEIQNRQLHEFYFRFMGPFYEHYPAREALDKEFRRANYYNLPGFEKLWEDAKRDGDGIALPGEE